MTGAEIALLGQRVGPSWLVRVRGPLGDVRDWPVERCGSTRAERPGVPLRNAADQRRHPGGGSTDEGSAAARCAAYRTRCRAGRRRRQYVALAPDELLGPIIPTDASHAGGLAGLTVDRAGGGLGVAAQPYTQAAAQQGVEPLPRAVVAPDPEVPINGLITNDKFCLTRHGRLALTWPRSHPLPRAWRHEVPVYAPRDDAHRRGG